MPPPSININDLPDQWEGGGDYWLPNSGQNHVVTYSFPDEMPEDWAAVETPLEIFAFQQFSEAAQASTTRALAQWAEVSNLVFFNVTPLNDAFNQGRMEFFAYNIINSDGVPSDGDAFGSHPNHDATHSREGDVRVNVGEPSFVPVQNGPGPGDSGFFLLMHEIGHAINFDHPGNYDVGTFPDWADTDAEQYDFAAEYFEDSRQYTVMSYFGEANTGADFNGNGADSLMLHDILVVQDAYGVNYDTRSGNTRYGYNSTEAGDDIHDWSVNVRPVYAIWDGGGTDWIDVSGSGTFNARIDLREGAFSNTHGMTSNIAIAYGAEIENAVGTGNGDTIIGNALGNRLYGGSGVDDISGRQGHDRIYGESGYDDLHGGWGNDSIWGGSGNDDIVASWGNDYANGGSGNDDISGGGGNDRLYGATGNDSITGGGGDDLVSGNNGNDTLEGNSGHDTIYGGAGDDSIDGGAGNDRIYGGTGDDTMNGGSGYDAVYFTSSGSWTVNLSSSSATNGYESDVVNGMEAVHTYNGNDHITGNGGGNFLNTGAGDDTLSGGLGNDNYLAGDGDDELVVLHGDNILNGGNGFDIVRYLVLGNVTVDLAAGGVQSTSFLTDDVLIGIEGALTSLGDDSLYGSNGANLLSANAGDDLLDGRAGHDTLLAGGGDDSVIGGSGNDSIDAGPGSDTVEGGSGIDSIHGGDGNDVLDGGWWNDVVHGDAGRDFVVGGWGNDLLTGGTEDDQLRGGVGNDTLIGGDDNDLLLGEAGNDVFRFDLSDGRDTIRDWNTGDNLIEIDVDRRFGFEDIDIQQVGRDTVIEFGKTQVTLLEVLATSVTKDDFDYV